eukprot:2931630-Rhodomonas_salina.2
MLDICNNDIRDSDMDHTGALFQASVSTPRFRAASCSGATPSCAIWSVPPPKSKPFHRDLSPGAASAARSVGGGEKRKRWNVDVHLSPPPLSSHTQPCEITAHAVESSSESESESERERASERERWGEGERDLGS